MSIQINKRIESLDLLDYDQYQRFSICSEILSTLQLELGQKLRVLDIGSNVTNDFYKYLNNENFHFTRSDVIEVHGDPDYVRICENQPLPFGDEHFDAVVGLEVLEHIKPEQRSTFLLECLRVSKHVLVLTYPCKSQPVIKSEDLANACYRLRNGSDHPFLVEHKTFGLPDQKDVNRVLEAQGYFYRLYSNSPLELWLTALLATEAAVESGLKQKQLSNLALQLVEISKTVKVPFSPYRRVLLTTKRPSLFASLTDQLRHLPTEESDADIGVEHALVRLASLIKDQLIKNSELEAKLASLTSQVMSDARRRSRLADWLPGKKVTQAELLPIDQIDWDSEKQTWLSRGKDPKFLMPVVLTPGVYSISANLKAEDVGLSELYFSNGEEFSPANRYQFDFSTRKTHYFAIRKTCRVLRFDPLDYSGPFKLSDFSIRKHWLPSFLLFFGFRSIWRVLTKRGIRNTVLQMLNGHLLGEFKDVLVPRNRHTPRPEDYRTWRQKNTPSVNELSMMRATIDKLGRSPRISIIIPVYNVQETYLRECLDSILAQEYENWEVCLADDASTQHHVRPIIEEYLLRDSRIKAIFRPKNGGISEASNSALSLATGDYVALVDNDDTIEKHALLRVAYEIVNDPTIDMLYSDEDKISLTGEYVDPFFKPDWSPEYFLSCMYTCHLGVYRTSLVKGVGGFRREYDFAQDYDLVLRLSRRAKKIVHIPDVLYHWRVTETSTASGADAKPTAHLKAQAALESHIAESGKPGRVEIGCSPGFHRVRFQLLEQPKISIVIPTASKRASIRGKEDWLLRACLNSIETNSTYKNYEVIVVDNDDIPQELQRAALSMGARIIPFKAPFNLAHKLNFGADHAEGDYLILLNDDIEVISPDWMESMLELAQFDEIGIVGAKLLFPDDRLQHVGVTILDGNPGHPFYRAPKDHPGYFNSNVCYRNYSAVTGACMMVKKLFYDTLGGYSLDFPLNYNDVDFCLRALEAGKRIVYTPYAKLYHHESVSKSGTTPDELHKFKARWGDRIKVDPFYNPNLSMAYSDFRMGAQKRKTF